MKINFEDLGTFDVRGVCFLPDANGHYTFYGQEIDLVVGRLEGIRPGHVFAYMVPPKQRADGYGGLVFEVLAVDFNKPSLKCKYVGPVLDMRSREGFSRVARLSKVSEYHPS